MPLQGNALSKWRHFNSNVFTLYARKTELFFMRLLSRWSWLRYVPNVSATSVQREGAWTSPSHSWLRKERWEAFIAVHLDLSVGKSQSERIL